MALKRIYVCTNFVYKMYRDVSCFFCKSMSPLIGFCYYHHTIITEHIYCTFIPLSVHAHRPNFTIMLGFVSKCLYELLYLAFRYGTTYTLQSHTLFVHAIFCSGIHA
jgi:hypothetical protein